MALVVLRQRCWGRGPGPAHSRASTEPPSGDRSMPAWPETARQGGGRAPSAYVPRRFLRRSPSALAQTQTAAVSRGFHGNTAAPLPCQRQGGIRRALCGVAPRAAVGKCVTACARLRQGGGFERQGTVGRESLGLLSVAPAGVGWGVRRPAPLCGRC